MAIFKEMVGCSADQHGNMIDIQRNRMAAGFSPVKSVVRNMVTQNRGRGRPILARNAGQCEVNRR